MCLLLSYIFCLHKYNDISKVKQNNVYKLHDMMFF